MNKGLQDGLFYLVNCKNPKSNYLFVVSNDSEMPIKQASNHHQYQHNIRQIVSSNSYLRNWICTPPSLKDQIYPSLTFKYFSESINY